MMKRVLITTTLLAGLLISCAKERQSDDPRCDDQPATGITCQAYWETWLYNSDTKKCELVGYSVCNEIGFKTKEECDLCDCD